MDFGLGETADAIRDVTARFAAEKIAPLAAEIDVSASIANSSDATLPPAVAHPIVRVVWRCAGRAGACSSGRYE